MTDGFRIERISVEGFKGFTNAQEVDLSDRHVFLIGPNGNGKSSIIEAIRWGLFGGRANDIVQNRGYAGDCCVKIGLAKDGKKWSLCRTLTPDDSSTHPELRDENGKECRMRDVLPQISSHDTGEGAHVIYASPFHRQPEDLSPFEKTVFSHLGLTKARAMLGHLNKFATEQDEEEETWDGRISEISKRVENEFADLKSRLGQILESRPWGGDDLPSRKDTENRMKEFAVMIGAAKPDEEFEQFSLEALVDELDDALEKKSGRTAHRWMRNLSEPIAI